MAKKRKISKKIIIGLLAVITVSILLGILTMLLLKSFNVKSYEISKLQNILEDEYTNLHLTEMDFMDVRSVFGFEKSEVEDALYLKSLEMDSEGNDITKDINYIVVMNTKNYQYYHDMFAAHIDSMIKYPEDDKELKLYNKAILKCDKNYVYVIISKKSKDIEKTINGQ